MKELEADELKGEENSEDSKEQIDDDENYGTENDDEDVDNWFS